MVIRACKIGFSARFTEVYFPNAGLLTVETCRQTGESPLAHDLGLVTDRAKCYLFLARFLAGLTKAEKTA